MHARTRRLTQELEAARASGSQGVAELGKQLAAAQADLAALRAKAEAEAAAAAKALASAEAERDARAKELQATREELRSVTSALEAKTQVGAAAQQQRVGACGHMRAPFPPLHCAPPLHCWWPPQLHSHNLHAHSQALEEATAQLAVSQASCTALEARVAELQAQAGAAWLVRVDS